MRFQIPLNGDWYETNHENLACLFWLLGVNVREGRQQNYTPQVINDLTEGDTSEQSDPA